jgi:hypothetical protein
MVACAARLLLTIGLLSMAAFLCATDPPAGLFRGGVCELSRDFPAWRDRLVSVRGVYYNGLQQRCSASCATSPWPSSLWLVGDGGESGRVLLKAVRIAELGANRGNRVEVWVTGTGRLRTMARRSPAGPCDAIGSGLYGYGHLGAWPAELDIERFEDIQLRRDATSPYDYTNFTHRRRE